MRRAAGSGRFSDGPVSSGYWCNKRPAFYKQEELLAFGGNESSTPCIRPGPIPYGYWNNGDT